MTNNEAKKEMVRLFRDDNSCFLDGKPAKIVGWSLGFPIVSQDNTALDVEWSWTGALRIMQRDRRFRT